MLCILAVCIKKRRPFYRVSFCLSFANALQRSALLDELPRRPRAAPVAAQSVRFRLLDQLVPVHRHAVLLCQVQYDFQIHVLFRPQEGNEDTEPVGKRHLFLDGIAQMDLIARPRARRLAYQVPPVARGVHHQVLRPPRGRAFQNRL